MKQIVQDARKGTINVIDIPIPAVTENTILVKTHYSLISAGTEKLMLEFGRKSLVGKARARPDLVKQVMQKAKREGVRSTLRRALTRLEIPLPMGYSCAGEIVEMGEGISGFRVGDRVACGGAGYANHAEFIVVPRHLFVKIPADVDMKDAAFVTVGSIALHGVRMASPGVNEYVGVIGLGLIGQITAQILHASGCKVFGFDIDRQKVDFALRGGMHSGSSKLSEARLVVDAFTQGRGLDSILITASTTSNEPIVLSGELARDRGRVVAVGAVNLDIPRRLFYDKELDFKISRSYGPGRYDRTYEEKGVDYPIGYVRWTENRNMETIIDMVADKRIGAGGLITHTFVVKDVHKAYSVITKTKGDYYGILIAFGDTKPAKKITLRTRPAAKTKMINVGIIGAGNFARDFIIPVIAKSKNTRLVGIATGRGLSAKYVADKFGASYITTEAREIMQDKSINCVFIMTRHALHTALVVDALKNGKDVFVEKPMAMNYEELKDIIKIWEKTDHRVMVGYNRRFAPHVTAIKGNLIIDSPANIVYRVNAGVVPPDSWIHDIAEGGGRIIGEVCHFVDLLIHLTESNPVRVYANTAVSYDNISALIEFENGSLGTIIYTPLGDSSFSKERIEIYSAGKVAVIDDFKYCTMFADQKEILRKRGPIRKGFSEEITAFFKSITAGEESPIKFQQLIAGTVATLKIRDSISKAGPEHIDVNNYLNV